MKYRTYGDLIHSESERAEYESVLLGESFLSAIWRHMEQDRISKAELARRLGCDRSTVTRYFDSGRNLTLQTMASILRALELRARFDVYDPVRPTKRCQPPCLSIVGRTRAVDKQQLVFDGDQREQRAEWQHFEAPVSLRAESEGSGA